MVGWHQFIGWLGTEYAAGDNPAAWQIYASSGLKRVNPITHTNLALWQKIQSIVFQIDCKLGIIGSVNSLHLFGAKPFSKS